MFLFRKFIFSIIPNQDIHPLSRNRPCKHNGPCDSRSDCPCFINKAHCRNTCRCTKTCTYSVHSFPLPLSPSPFSNTQASEDGKAAIVPKPKKYVGQRNVLVSEQMWNAILRFVFRVVQSTYRCFAQSDLSA